MSRLEIKRLNKVIRKNRVRSTVSGTAQRPRLSVHVSNRTVSAQIIDDTTGTTLVSAATTHKKDAPKNLTEQAAIVGAEIAKKATKANITKVAFDRNGRSYQQRLAAFADAARENGLEF